MGPFKVLLILGLLAIAASQASAFSYATGSCATGGCADGEQWLYTNANEVDTALDNIETNVTALQARDTIAEHESVDGVNVILSTEIDTAAELNALTTDEDMVLDSDIGVTVQAYDADLADLADGSLQGSKIGAPGGLGIDASVITTGTMSSTARLPSAVIESSEIDTSAELNAIILDTDFLTASGTYNMSVTGNAAFTGTLQGAVAVTTVSDTTATLLSTTTIGSLYYCTNAAGCDVTLPTASAGLNACFYDGNGGGVVVLDAATGDKICLDGVCPVGTAEAIDSAGNIGDFVCILAVDSTNWVTLGRSGTWVTGGAD